MKSGTTYMMPSPVDGEITILIISVSNSVVYLRFFRAENEDKIIYLNVEQQTSVLGEGVLHCFEQGKLLNTLVVDFTSGSFVICVGAKALHHFPFLLERFPSKLQLRVHIAKKIGI